MHLKTFDVDGFLKALDQALGVAETLAPLGGPAAVTAVTIAKAVDDAVQKLRADADLALAVAAADSADKLDALQPRVDTLTADTERMLDET